MSRIKQNGSAATYNFTLVEDCLIYFDDEVNLLGQSKQARRTIPTDSMTALPSDDGDLCSFRLLSKVKSFYLKCETPEIAADWIAAINTVVDRVHMHNGTKVISEHECYPIFARKADTSSCQQCSKSFSMLDRRHHCRNCGKVCCDMCSREKVRIERIHPRQLYKVCTECANTIKDNRKYGVNR